MQVKTARMSSKGQLVLPREVRERLGLKQGDAVDFVLDDAGIHLQPSRAGDNPFLAWIGVTAGPMPVGEATTEEFIRATRHEGLSDEELSILHSGPGAIVIRHDENGEEV